MQEGLITFIRKCYKQPYGNTFENRDNVLVKYKLPKLIQEAWKT